MLKNHPVIQVINIMLFVFALSFNTKSLSEQKEIIIILHKVFDFICAVNELENISEIFS